LTVALAKGSLIMCAFQLFIKNLSRSSQVVMQPSKGYPLPIPIPRPGPDQFPERNE